MSCAETAEPINLSFGLWIPVSRRKHKFNRICQVAPMCLHGRTRWHHMANTTEPSICGSDAVLCQIILISCLLTLKDFQSQAATYTVKVVISQRRCYYRSLTGDDIMAYWIVAILMTVSDFQGHAPNEGLLKCDFSNICAACAKISTVHRKATPRQRHFLLLTYLLYWYHLLPSFTYWLPWFIINTHHSLTRGWRPPTASMVF